MKSNKLLLSILVLALVTGCSGGSSNSNIVTGTLLSLAVTPANPSIAPGTTETFIATGIYSNNTTQDLTASAIWSSSAASVAAISNGKATSVGPGQTTIMAASGSVSGSTTLTVTTATIASLAVTPVNPVIIAGSKKQLTATGTFSDNTTQDLTSMASWNSSSQSVATISNAAGSNGLVTSLATGTTTIAATWGGASDSTLLTVNGSASGSNVLTLTVNGSNCSNSYPNKPCVSVTVCSPGTSTCQIISDILLDTGSSGLRIFKSLLTVSLNPVISGSGSLAECIQYADGSSDWGPVQTADVILGNEPAVQVPVQVIDSTFGSVPISCGIPDKSPAATGFNGILGLGLFTEDCGSGCANSASNGIYYACIGSACSSAKAPLSNQVQNPVALLPVDNNGVILQLPGISLGGTPSVSGSLILGIGTQSNNSPSVVTTYAANSIGEFITVFNGSTYNQSFIDSGSNALYFPAPSNVLQVCTGIYTGWFCPSSTTSLTATTKGATGLPSNSVSFEIGNATNLFNTPNSVFSELGGSVTGPTQSLYFDWGLPFFLGRIVYVGIEGKASSLGTGPYWAY